MENKVEDVGSSADQPLMLDRALPENSAEYMLFVLDDSRDGTTASKPLANLEKIRKAAVQLSEKLTRDYIWQRDAFQLEVVSRKGMAYLHGITDYGDCVEDEWLVVYMLRELTKSFPGTWARICDNDGEFLLVEAARTVPKWLNPEIDAHRVWIHEGRLEVIPVADSNISGPASHTKPNPPALSLRDAVEIIKSAPGTLVHIPSLESEAFYRLEKYPGHIESSVHYARALVPRKVAYILHDRPRSIAPASEAFYTRDAASMKRMFSSENSHSLNFPPADLVAVSIKLTKVIFAQLRGQRFSPPASWATEFASYVETEVHKHATEMHGGNDETVDKAQVMANLGMKITCGFELMAATAATSNHRIVREVGLILDDLKEDGDDASVLPSDDEIRAWKDVDREDDEAWLDIDFDDFERELDSGRRATGETPSVSSSSKQPRWEVEPGFDTGFGDAGVQTDLRKIVSRFQAFLNDDEAGLEGAEFDDMDDDDDDEDNDGDSDDDDEEDEDDDISLDEEEFSRMMREMMGMPAESKPAATKSVPTGATKAAEKAEKPTKATSTTTAVSRNVDTDTRDDDENEEDILKLAEQFEAELRGHGALRLEPPDRGAKGAKNGKAVVAKGGQSSSSAALEMDDEESDDDGEVDVDYNLAKNLLESFKSQEGMAGPAGNILSMLGLSLPRDDDMEDSEDEDEGHTEAQGNTAIDNGKSSSGKGRYRK